MGKWTQTESITFISISQTKFVGSNGRKEETTLTKLSDESNRKFIEQKDIGRTRQNQIELIIKVMNDKSFDHINHNKPPINSF